VCHNTDTDERKMGPSLKGLFKRDKLVNGKPVNADNVKALINSGGNGMPSYADMLSDDEKDNVIAYLKTL
jgi:cytochrome c